MPFSNKIADLEATNQLKISLVPMTRAQAWTSQVRGAYALLYPYITIDFMHLGDFAQWLESAWAPHQHGNGNNGSPTTQPMTPGQFTTAVAQSYTELNPSVGVLRTEFNDVLQTIEMLNTVKLVDGQ